MKVVIVGGGSAGWMTAAYLKTALANLEEVTLIRSSNISTIGVGEASFSTLKLFFDYLGLVEHEWMPSCNATYKLAIRFENWTKTRGHFYHPFERYEVVDGFNLGDWWLKLLDGGQRFDTACFTAANLCENLKSPRFFDGAIFDDKVAPYFSGHRPPNAVIRNHSVQYPYGYHFDASLLADFLKKFATERGVREVIDDVMDVDLSDDGYISHLVTKEHGRVDGDIYIDCTGFRGVLINRALKEPFIGFHESLPNDSAVSIQVPRSPGEGIKPYTTATALRFGWAWTIPLYKRDGCGYVYSSKYIGRDEAEAEFREFIGPSSDGCNANHIKMRIGRNRNSWVKNCVAIGLSSGFVEPLESTGIFFIQHAIEELVHHFPRASVASEGQLLSYNRIINDCFDGICEFLSLHYLATDRSDTPYWRDRNNLRKSEALKERLMIWRSRLPGARNINQSFHGFEAYSYSVMMLGLNYRPKNYLPALDHLDEANARSLFRSIREKSDRLVRALPSHYDYLEHMRSATLACS
jgi:tryptophan halogenase